MTDTANADDPSGGPSVHRDAGEERRARQHVGAAGFAQRDALERIIVAGRDQILFTQSLRTLLADTLAHLHALPLMDLYEAAGPHVAVLEQVAEACWAQMETAAKLRETIERGLTEIRGTPVEHISAHLLVNLSQVVQRQATELQTLITLANTETSTLQQIAGLHRVSVQTHKQLLSVEREQAEQEMVRLDREGRDALERIRQLEDEGASYADQKARMERDATQTRRHLADLEGEATRDARDLARLEAQAQASRRQVDELEEAARGTQERIASLRRRLEERHLERPAGEPRPPAQDGPDETRT